jgi:hypothetical protein
MDVTALKQVERRSGKSDMAENERKVGSEGDSPLHRCIDSRRVSSNSCIRCCIGHTRLFTQVMYTVMTILI